MKHKTLLSTLIALFIVGNLFAQDKIFLSNGNVIDAKVKEVTANKIFYVLSNNQDGPKYSISKNDVDKIKYQNGSEDKFNDDASAPLPSGLREVNEDKTAKSKSMYKAGLLSISPFQFTENGVGFSLSYERRLDKDGMISYVIPFITTFDLANNNNDAYGATSTTNKQDAMFYLSPGLKFYPTGSFGKVKYAVGPSLVIGVGQHTEYNTIYDPISYQPTTTANTQDKFILGMMITNSMNVNLNSKFYMGLDLGVGFTYINQWGGVNQGMAGIVQGGFKMGMRL